MKKRFLLWLEKIAIRYIESRGFCVVRPIIIPYVRKEYQLYKLVSKITIDDYVFLHNEENPARSPSNPLVMYDIYRRRVQDEIAHQASKLITIREITGDHPFHKILEGVLYVAVK